MRSLVLFAIASLSGLSPAAAQEGASVRAKAKSAVATIAPASAAPFRADAVFESGAVNFEPNLEREPIPGSCTVSGAAVCYDYRTGRAVFKPARSLMPDIAGMRRESLTLKRDRITLNYSFK